MKLLETIAEQAEVNLAALIHDAMSGMEPARSRKTVHASDVTREDFCARRVALLDEAKTNDKPSYVSAAQRITYDYGRFVQHELNHVWLRDRMFGNWRCLACKALKTYRRYPDFACECGKKLWEYEEIQVKSDEHGISGSIDALVDVGKPKLRLVECKTIDKDQFKDLKAPLAEHRVRTSLYLWLAERADIPLDIDTQVGHLLYVSKSWGFKSEKLVALKQKGKVKDNPISPFKEFLIHRDDSSFTEKLAMARTLKLWRDGNGPMPHGICTSVYSKAARECAVAKLCFSGKYPAGVH